MTKVMGGHILLDNKDRRGHAYVELLDDGRIKAGYFADTAKTYESAEEAHVRFKESITFSDNLSAWNICDCLEDYMAKRDDGR
jgi:hypothetical protein